MTAITTTTTLDSTRASSYLQQLCKHFSHKMEVEFTAEQGSIRFPFGVCTLSASDNALRMVGEAEDEDSLARLEKVIASHLERFAFRDKPALTWTRTTA